MINNDTRNSEQSRPSGKQDLEANLLAIVENADGLIYSLDRDLRYITLNRVLKKKLKDLFGVDAKAGDVTYDFLNGIDPEESEFWKEIYTVALNGESLQFVKEFNYSGVQEFWRFSVNPIRHNGEITGLSCFAHDMTELRKARIAMETSEKKYRLMFSSNLLPSWVYDADTLQFTDVNDAAIRHYGYSREEFLSKTIMDICPPNDLVKLMEMISNRKHLERAYKVERQHIKKNGEIIDVSVLTCPIGIDDKINILVLAEDITQRKEIEEAIQRLNEGLEEQVQQRTLELTQANAQLEAFSYTVSHDLQSPMRVVSGFTQIILEEYGDRIDAEGKNMLQIIHTNALRMNQLIRDLLDFARLGATQCHREHTDMDAIVRIVAEELRMSAPCRPAEIKIDHLAPASCDRVLMRQVWTNLIGNALKYSSKKEHPLIEIGSSQTGADVTYYIKDNGAGFDMKHAQKLFTVFKRMHSQEEFEGTGVGLATVHSIISRHGGRIWAEAAPDTGATFYFTLAAE